MNYRTPNAAASAEGWGSCSNAPTSPRRRRSSRVVTVEVAPPASECRAGSYFADLPLRTITPNPRQPRTVFDEEAMDELVDSIREVGLLQPIVVRPLGGATFELVMGERRWRAAQQAGLDTHPGHRSGDRGPRPAP